MNNPSYVIFLPDPNDILLQVFHNDNSLRIELIRHVERRYLEKEWNNINTLLSHLPPIIHLNVSSKGGRKGQFTKHLLEVRFIMEENNDL